MPNYLSRDEMMSKRMSVRVTGRPEVVDILASKIVIQVEAMGQQVVEWSKGYPVRDEPNKVHVYLNIDTTREVMDDNA